MTDATNITLISQYNHSLLSVHYVLLNLFRILRPIRLKYKLSINELIFLDGVYCFSRHVSTSFSQYTIHDYIKYFSRPKSRYYVSSLVNKGCLSVCDIIRGKEHYKLTSKGISILSEYEADYLEAINKYYIDNNISL